MGRPDAGQTRRAPQGCPVLFLYVLARLPQYRIEFSDHGPGKSKSATAASFIRPTRAADAPQTFVSAVQLKYASELTADQRPLATQKQVIISGNVAEEIGFDKARRKLAQLGELKVVILDGSRIAYASHPAGSSQNIEDNGQSISQVCPKITELDVSRNLFEHFGTVVDICAELSLVRSLRVKYKYCSPFLTPCKKMTNRAQRQSLPRYLGR